MMSIFRPKTGPFRRGKPFWPRPHALHDRNNPQRDSAVRVASAMGATGARRDLGPIGFRIASRGRGHDREQLRESLAATFRANGLRTSRYEQLGFAPAFFTSIFVKRHSCSSGLLSSLPAITRAAEYFVDEHGLSNAARIGEHRSELRGRRFGGWRRGFGRRRQRCADECADRVIEFRL